MKCSNALKLVMTASLIGLAGLTARAAAQSSAFSYQGNLANSGSPFNGTANFQFSLWDHPSAGSQIGATQSISGVQITNGLVTVALNDTGQFGESAFTGQQRWLAISVNGTPLSPRQPLTAAPYALYALSGAGSGNSPWIQIGTIIHYDAGNVGIGTATPAERLHVAGGNLLADRGTSTQGVARNLTLGGARGSSGTNYATIAFQNYDNNSTLLADYVGAQISSQNSSGADSGDLRFLTKDSTGSLTARVLIDPIGNIGIGTMSPAVTLDVVGSAQVDGTTFRVDSTNHRVGIGTSSPGVVLDVVGDCRFDGTTFRVDSTNHRVGIGTSSPNVALDVVGDCRIDGTTLRVDSTNRRVGIGTSSPGVALDVVGDGRIDGATFRVDSTNHRVGIGTASPGELLQVSGGNLLVDRGSSTGTLTRTLTIGGARGTAASNYAAINFQNYDSDSTLLADYTGAQIAARNNGGDDGGDLRLNVRDSGGNLTTRVLIDPAGYVGIGTTSPAAMLHAVDGTTSSNNPAVRGVHTQGIFGIGVQGEGGSVGVNGVVVNTGSGTFKGVAGSATGGSSGTNYGVYGEASGATSGTRFAGYFQGNVHVNGTLSKSAGAFKIDHPLDPANKYLWHSFVESPDMMNIYNGNITTDAHGNATVQLPDWFEALNRDFRYQLTVIGSFARAMVAEEVKNNAFVIRTDQPNVKVSWQVTGIRQDAAAEAHRIPVEQVKPDSEKGSYLTPELFGQTEEQRVDKWLDAQRDAAAPAADLAP